MASKIPQMLPPKMAQRFADRAKAGEGCRLSTNSEVTIFDEGNERITLVCLDPPMGHMVRISTSTK